MIDAPHSTSTRPYLVRALYEWCTVNGFTPYVAVKVDDTVQVPKEYVKDGEIVLNISFDATSSLKLGNDFIEFSARFAGTAREIIVPIENVTAIYARENGQGMAFPQSDLGSKTALAPEPKLPIAEAASKGEADNKLLKLTHSQVDSDILPTDPPRTGTKARPTLTRIK